MNAHVNQQGENTKKMRGHPIDAITPTHSALAKQLIGPTHPSYSIPAHLNLIRPHLISTHHTPFHPNYHRQEIRAPNL